MSFVSAHHLLPIVLLHFVCYTFAQSSIEKADQAYDDGKDYYYDGEYQKALPLFEQALQIYQTENDSLAIAKTYRRVGDANRYLKYNSNAIDNYSASLAILEQIEGFALEDKADILIRIGHTYSQMYLPKKANEWYNKSLEIYSEQFGEESSEVGNLYMNLGISATQVGKYRDALAYFDKTFSIFKLVSDSNSVDFNRIYSNLGYLYRKMGDYDRSIQFGEKALEIKLMNYASDHPSVPKYYRNIGRAYEQKGDIKKALPYFQKTVDLLEQSLGTDHPSTGGSYGELANILAELGQSDKALGLYHKANRILESRYAPTHPYLVAGYFNIGRVYEDIGDDQKALELYNEVLDKFAQSSESPVALIAQAKRQIAGVFFHQKDYSKAIEVINAGLVDLSFDKRWWNNNEYDNPPLTAIQTETEFLALLERKAYTLEKRGEQKNSIDDLKAAYNTSKLCIQLIQQLNELYPSESSKEWLYEESDPIYAMSVRQSFSLYERSRQAEYLENALQISTQNKANLLIQQIQTDQARRIAQLPEKEIESVIQLEAKLQSAREAFTQNPTTETQKNLRNTTIAFDQKEQTLIKQYPRYQKLKFQKLDLDFNAIMEQISSNTMLLDYFVTEQAVYTFLLSQNGLEGIKTEITQSFNNAIQSLKEQQISSIISDNNQIQDYNRHISLLYKTLIAPIQNQLASVDHLIIIPHNSLHYVSFDLLASVVNGKNFKELDYLIKTHNIQYAWSMELWQGLSPFSSAKNYQFSFLGIAPSFNTNQLASNDRGPLSSLKFSIQEIEAIQKIMDGKVFKAADANKQNFLKDAARAKVLHFATHAIVNDENPNLSGLYLSDGSSENGFLSALEIYGLDLSAELAVMSACNTGRGKLIKGEGVMNLGRAFTYAGSKSVLMSLWLANDQSTAKIMEQFYQHLSEGKSKDQALRLAKLSYLETADPLQSHPYFWAGIVAHGDMSPINKTFSWLFFWWLIPLLGLVGWWILKNYR